MTKTSRRLLFGAGTFAALLAWTWASLAAFYFGLPAWFAAFVAVAVPAAAWRFREQGGAWITAAAFAAIASAHLSVRPSNVRDWTNDQTVLPEIRIDGDRVTIRNVRDFSYSGPEQYEPRYVDRAFDLSRLDSVDFAVEHFSAWEGAGHTLLSFGFEGKEHVAISVEIRKEKGETYSAVGGCFRQYELMYVIGTDRDLIGLRANHRKDEVYLHPVKAPREKIRAMFTGMLERAAKLQRQPEFYHTITSACTTNLVDHVNAISPRRVPFTMLTRAAGYADVVAREVGLIDASVPLEELRARNRINDAAAAAAGAGDEEFSRAIRASRR